MKSLSRRDFVTSTMATGVALTGTAPRTVSGGRASLLADSRIDVLLAEPIGTIAPEIYGHFVEHLGGVVYDGIWVGEESSIPNIGGIRRAIVDALRPIRPSVVRWPGGCFADSYDWRDGIGPREQRPRRTNFWIDQRALQQLGNVPAKFDTNHFGTNEFIRFCRLVDAQPYLAVNVRSLPARAFFEWLEYCNSPAGSTTLAEQRAAAGEPEPFGVKYWGVGNESWGCGGNFTPEEYAAEYRRFATWAVPDYGFDLAFIGSGPSGRDLEWTRRFFRALDERRNLNRMWGWGLHHYTSAPNGEAVTFDDTAWYDLLSSANRMDSLITAQWQVMGELDREHRIKLVVDEWGAWHRMTTNVDPAHLFGQQSTIRDALVAGLTLDTFNRHADKVAMANIAQLVNCIHSLFLADEDQFLLTPTYHVFAMYAAHQGAKAVRIVCSAPSVRWRDGEERDRSLWGLNGSASVRDNRLTLTVTNSHLTEPRETEITIRGAGVGAVTATTLTAFDVHDHNTFEHPETVVPTTAMVRANGSPFVYRFPAASVTKLEIALRT
jgi:alpha-N-arabinofuranosidase